MADLSQYKDYMGKSFIVFLRLKVLVTIIGSGFSLQALAQKLPDDSQLAAGQCYSLPDSKNYLLSLKAKPESNTNTIKEIGADRIKNLNDTDNENFYFCKVQCKRNSGAMQALKEAALLMSKMVDGSAEGEILLKNYVAKLIVSNWQFKIDFQNAESIVQNMLKINGRFLEYGKN